MDFNDVCVTGIQPEEIRYNYQTGNNIANKFFAPCHYNKMEEERFKNMLATTDFDNCVITKHDEYYRVEEPEILTCFIDKVTSRRFYAWMGLTDFDSHTEIYKFNSAQAAIDSVWNQRGSVVIMIFNTYSEVKEYYSKTE
jgi:hypothetical protein